MSDPLTPTFQGYVDTTLDALILFEACLSGTLSHATRRPNGGDLIQSGDVFIYNDKSSGIKRWTDGKFWSPSRILDNFLVYRELERFVDGKLVERKQASKKRKKMGSSAISKPQSHLDTNNKDRPLIGSLVDSYDFEPNGLVKKTIKITYQNGSHRLVSYYRCEDVKQGRLFTPSKHDMLQSIIPRKELMEQNFKVPLDSTSVDSTYGHSYHQVPMEFIQWDGTTTGYSTNFMASYDPNQQFPMQLQQEQQQFAMLWPYY
ncbi:Global transcription regulator sge1 [Fusarium piperis]|uniref:Global transcription regulator sge1 n=1 Tax=Fusarium piperis TaxID=1435070 RepID=A0A9W9BQN8_9HYPO|nr:Global transcription regulator sge1 [Fusarium piperis]